MAFERFIHRIPHDAPGTATDLVFFRAGPANAAKKVYLQAALHADEQPGIMVIHHLLPLLQKADAEGALNARFVIFPMVNPLGMDQIHFQVHGGRYDDRSGTNFNRKWPDLYKETAKRIAPKLTGDAQPNVRIIREAVKAWLDSLDPAPALQKLRHFVMTEAYDADYVLDLHCDNEALSHLFVTPDSMAELTELADWMGSAAQLTAEDSGGGSFDEVWPSLWTRLRAAHPDKPIPFSAVAATLEYRGSADVFDDLGQKDAENLFSFFQSKGLIAGTPARTPEKAPAATPLNATQIVRAAKAGLLAYRVKLGERVEKGQPIADLIALEGPDAFTARTPILAGTAGLVLSRKLTKYVVPGDSIAKIVGTEPLDERGGYLLED
ncbi:succinylglutamate desuccinylase/aspartoacylase family protein [Pelagibacterium xiamenense]|uniref:succinylglutamate desuccinylase/aspartoacylase family protein n=1 Tax=Pelagibacterium xiamenense TaxID=2901140 RepID=UPI001E4F38E5|nr:succinylglutamate desuccinylase/aspartoacylase family protein [Pelagibacterium xiamenense]MCD7060399.1 M14 family metallopeptidase [Pelagibacterium xiamenense]